MAIRESKDANEVDRCKGERTRWQTAFRWRFRDLCDDPKMKRNEQQDAKRISLEKRGFEDRRRVAFGEAMGMKAI
jgi:hypothetical protein